MQFPIILKKWIANYAAGSSSLLMMKDVLMLFEGAAAL
jgi:hypothetical protein